MPSRGPPKLPPDQATTVADSEPPRPRRPDTSGLPTFEVPPHAARLPSPIPGDPGDTPTAPRVGGYALLARFPSSASADVFLGQKVTPFGFLRRAVVKWVDATRPEQAAATSNLRDEARALSVLDHPNVVSIYDHDEDEHGAFLAVEYVEGTDLRRVLIDLARRRERLPPEVAAFVVAEVLRGLVHVHGVVDAAGASLDIVHRDISPSNVLLGRDGRVKLTDFGAVHMVGRSQTDTAPGMVKGKVRYLAPEYVAEQRCRQSCDVYGCGVVLFELLVGGPAFESSGDVTTMVAIVRDGLDYRRLDQAGCPSLLAHVVRDATARDPAERFPSAEAFVRALERALEALGLFVSPTRLSDVLAAVHPMTGP